MATQTVIQDVEAEDKFVGPLTLKQFIFAAGGVLAGYLSFFMTIKHAYFMLVFTIPPMLVGLFLAIPWSKEQPTELWVLAKIRYLFKPRVRIWSQDGVLNLVTITAPKKVERQLTKNLNETQVKNRLKILADTIDSRGWAIKESGTIGYGNILGDDRLVKAEELPQQVPTLSDSDIHDPLDEKSSVVAAQIKSIMQNSGQTIINQAVAKMEQARSQENTLPANPASIPLPTPAPHQSDYKLPSLAEANNAGSIDEKLLSEQLKQSSSKSDLSTKNMHTISAQPQIATTTDEKKPQASMPQTVNADIINLSRNNDLNVETIARQARQQQSDGEVVISLH